VVGLCDKFELFLDGYGDVSVIPSGHDLKRLRRGEGGSLCVNITSVN
jgi:hypothetical protein